MAITAAATYASVVLVTRAAAFSSATRLPSLSSGLSLKSIKLVSSDSRRRVCPVITRASSSDEPSIEANELISDLKEKWDAVENKSTVLIYGGGAILALWLSSVVVGAINSVPLLPKLMELVGLGYTGWFVYRYLLFKESRKELASDIESLKKKVAGTE